MKNHYLPQFLLRRFADHDDGLWQFDIYSGNLERRNVKNAGQRRHFYSDELETNLLQRLDGEAGAVFAKGLMDNSGRVLVTPHERQQLARWLALFVMRTPASFEHFESHIDKAAKNPEEVVSVIYDDTKRYVQHIKESKPELYATVIKEWGLVDGEALLLEAMANLARQRTSSCLPEAKDAFVDHITNDRVDDYAARLLKMQWTWFRTCKRFIIGDNPLCRWSKRTNKWNYGISHKDVVITIPMSRYLCLRLQRRQCRAVEFVHCDARTTREYNWRQLLSSVRNVYGPQQELRHICKQLVQNALATGKLSERPQFAP